MNEYIFDANNQFIIINTAIYVVIIEWSAFRRRSSKDRSCGEKGMALKEGATKIFHTEERIIDVVHWGTGTRGRSSYISLPS